VSSQKNFGSGMEILRMFTLRFGHPSLAALNGTSQMNNPVGWFEIYVQDMPRARAFYEAVFGASFSQLESPGIEMWGFQMDQSTYGASGALVKMSGFPSGGNSVLVYFHCADCAIEADKAVKAGGVLQRAKMSIGQYGFIALVFDTEGNMIGLHSMQ